MKWIVYLLLLANISFFAWHYQGMDREQRRLQVEQQSRADTAVRLVLLREAKMKPEARSKSHVPQCRSLGPFGQRNKAQGIKKLLQKQGLSLHLRVSNEARRKAYWVYLAPFDSHAAARKAVQKLKNKYNVDDIFIVSGGEIKDGISLGVFSMVDLAHRRQSDISKLGFDAQLKDVNLPAKEYWLDWPQQSVAGLSDSQRKVIMGTGDSTRIIKTDCRD